MDEKIFDLMSQMYSEFKDFKKEVSQRFDAVDQRLDATDQRVDKLSNQLVHFENDIKKDIGTLFDGYKLTYEKLGVLEQKVDNINEKALLFTSFIALSIMPFSNISISGLMTAG